MIRVVLDTNVLVSAVIRPGGKSDQIVRQGPGRFELLTSEFIVAEVEEILARRHIQRKYQDQVTASKRVQVIASLRALATMVQVQSDLSGVVADPDDAEVLATAADGFAEYLVTGDRHLLALGTYKAIQIVTPTQFLDILQQGEQR